MTLIECTYHILKQAQLTTTREAFSREYVGRSRSWFAYTAHMKRDFSPAAAIQCLRSIRCQLERDTALNGDQKRALAAAECELLQHLIEQHCIAEICS
jgi:hypothetical protein